jgi:hypothetical protein
MVLLILTATLAGCTGGDPDGGDGTDGIDAETLQGMIEAGLQDFMNNTTVEITTNYYTNETSTTTNNVNGSGGDSTSSLHALSGTDSGESSLNFSASYEDMLALLVREDAYAAATAGNSAGGLDGANICVGIGTTTEHNLVDWFSSMGIAFTSVPVAGAAEASAKFIDGSCDVFAGGISALIAKKSQLDGDGSMNGVDIWITNTIGYTTFHSNASGWSVLNLTIDQNYGVSSNLLAAHGEVTLVGTCITNCTGQSAIIYHTYVFSTGSFASNNTTTGGSIDFSNTCDDMPNFASWSGGFGPAGLECELDMTMFASTNSASWWEHNITSFDDYEFAWSDWSYYVLWQSTAVTMHE